MYLTTLSFNGIYRVNQEGQFNVPYGGRSHLKVLDKEKLAAASKALASAEIHQEDFADALSHSMPKDLVYLDPPYTVVHGTNGFLRYNARIFSWDDQARLAKVAISLRNQGCYVLMTNANHRSIRELYSGFRFIEVTRSSCMAATPKFRRPVTELVITNVE